ncbi:hypothetical protein [Streptomyces ziwulingensis]|uniref:Uncharacterized protein n=1 Tax=Streptomyces ziwulingensis TaxID=1045501 RepID=A0ABP9C401_9ACTN
MAKAQAGTKPSGEALRGETVACHDAGRPGDPTAPPRVRDRHRTAAASAPEISERPLGRRHTTAATEPGAPGTGHLRPCRSTGDRTPAALQVFRR